MPANMRSAAVVTVLNLKGGVGKTHTSWLLASVGQERKDQILLIDLDTQANLTRSFLDAVEPEQSAAALFNPAAEIEASSIVHHTTFSHIDLIPAVPQLSAFDVSKQADWEETDSHLALIDPIQQLRSQYDLIVIDCPPRLSLVSFAALCAADFIIIPLEAADWGAQGVTQVAEAARYVQARYNNNLELLGYLVSRFKKARGFQQTYWKKLRQHFGRLAFDTIIPDLARFEQSVTERVPITLHSKGSIEAGIARRLYAEVQRRISRSRRTRAGGRRQGISNATAIAAAA
jgi:chromosome partitioning protein